MIAFATVGALFNRLTVILKLVDIVALDESVATTVTCDVPICESCGVPVNVRVPEVNVNQDGFDVTE